MWQERQGEEAYEGKNFPIAVRGQRRPEHEQQHQSCAQPEQGHDESLG